MKRKSILTISVILVTIVLKAQTNYITIGNDIRLPKDSIEVSRLINSLECFLLEVRHRSNENKYLSSSEKPENDLLLKQLKDVAEKQKSDNSLKPYLSNISSVESNIYLVQFAFIGVLNDNPYLQAIFEILAKKEENDFLFFPTLSRNTKDWKKETNGYLTSYFQPDNKEYAVEYMRYMRKFDEILGVFEPTTLYFCENCETLQQLMQLSGVLYQLDYNGLTWSMIDFETPNMKFAFYPNTFYSGKSVDPHDIFHGRANTAIPYEERNWYMICGCAYIYGGNWGMDWSDIKRIFKERMTYDKNTDWLTLYYERYNFGESKEKYLFTTQFINALIIEDLEKRKGFAEVLKLLASKNMYKDRKAFFGILDNITGINEQNFNQNISKLVDEAMK